MFTGSGVDAANQTVRNIPRIARLKLRRPVDDLALKFGGDGGGDAVDIYAAERAHRAEFQLVQAALDRGLRGLRDAGKHVLRQIGICGHHKIETPTVKIFAFGYIADGVAPPSMPCIS